MDEKDGMDVSALCELCEFCRLPLIADLAVAGCGHVFHVACTPSWSSCPHEECVRRVFQTQVLTPVFSSHGNNAPPAGHQSSSAGSTASASAGGQNGNGPVYTPLQRMFFEPVKVFELLFRPMNDGSGDDSEYSEEALRMLQDEVNSKAAARLEISKQKDEALIELRQLTDQVKAVRANTQREFEEYRVYKDRATRMQHRLQDNRTRMRREADVTANIDAEIIKLSDDLDAHPEKDTFPHIDESNGDDDVLLVKDMDDSSSASSGSSNSDGVTTIDTDGHTSPAAGEREHKNEKKDNLTANSKPAAVHRRVTDPHAIRVRLEPIRRLKEQAARNHKNQQSLLNSSERRFMELRDQNREARDKLARRQHAAETLQLELKELKQEFISLQLSIAKPATPKPPPAIAARSPIARAVAMTTAGLINNVSPVAVDGRIANSFLNSNSKNIFSDMFNQIEQEDAATRRQLNNGAPQKRARATPRASPTSGPAHVSADVAARAEEQQRKRAKLALSPSRTVSSSSNSSSSQGGSNPANNAPIDDDDFGALDELHDLLDQPSQQSPILKSSVATAAPPSPPSSSQPSLPFVPQTDDERLAAAIAAEEAEDARARARQEAKDAAWRNTLLAHVQRSKKIAAVTTRRDQQQRDHDRVIRDAARKAIVGPAMRRHRGATSSLHPDDDSDSEQELVAAATRPLSSLSSSSSSFASKIRPRAAMDDDIAEMIDDSESALRSYAPTNGDDDEIELRPELLLQPDHDDRSAGPRRSRRLAGDDDELATTVATATADDVEPSSPLRTMRDEADEELAAIRAEEEVTNGHDDGHGHNNGDDNDVQEISRPSSRSNNEHEDNHHDTNNNDNTNTTNTSDDGVIIIDDDNDRGSTNQSSSSSAPRKAAQFPIAAMPARPVSDRDHQRRMKMPHEAKKMADRRARESVASAAAAAERGAHAVGFGALLSRRITSSNSFLRQSSGATLVTPSSMSRSSSMSSNDGTSSAKKVAAMSSSAAALTAALASVDSVIATAGVRPVAAGALDTTANFVRSGYDGKGGQLRVILSSTSPEVRVERVTPSATNTARRVKMSAFAHAARLAAQSKAAAPASSASAAAAAAAMPLFTPTSLAAAAAAKKKPHAITKAKLRGNKMEQAAHGTPSIGNFFNAK